MATPATLVIDASLNKRIATELKRRGRDAIALSELQLRHAKDPELLQALAEHYGERPWVLVTADDNLPAAHADVVAEVNATIATIDPRRSVAYADDEDAWGREVAHRWAHMMERQPMGSVRRYSDRGGRKWLPRRR